MASQSRRSEASAASTKKTRVDWDAVERDYRTGRFTLRELEAKHGVNNAQIARKKKAQGWTQDLSDAVRQATNAMLMTEIVSNEISAAQQNVSNAVLAAAEVNTRIIQGHRARLSALHEAVDAAKQKLMTLGYDVADIREAAVLVQAVGNLAAATKTLIEQERKAHNLDDDPDTSDNGKRKRVILDFVDVVAK